MSLILSTIVTSASGMLAGLAVTGGLLWRQSRALARARYTAEHDDTTGLPNRRALLSALHRCQHSRSAFGVIILDLDHFKHINDRFGHQAGNDLLTAVGQRLTCLGPPVTLAARLSGDEFALLVCGGPDSVAAAAQSAWAAIGHMPIRLEDRQIAVRASVGYSTSTLAVSHRMLLHQADMAMYLAKRDGNGVCGATVSTAHTDLGRTTARYRDRPHD